MSETTPHGRSYVRGIIPDAVNREKDDFYPTPPRATYALLGVERFWGAIWEPACGDGAISKVLEGAGHKVYFTDLIDRGYGEGNRDFLLDYETRADHVITNPPFKLAEEFVLHALSCTEAKVAVLCRLAWLEGKGRYQTIFQPHPPARIWAFSSRVAMLRGGKAMAAGGGGMMAFCWIVWDKQRQVGPTSFGWLP